MKTVTVIVHFMLKRSRSDCTVQCTTRGLGEQRAEEFICLGSAAGYEKEVRSIPDSVFSIDISIQFRRQRCGSASSATAAAAHSICRRRSRSTGCMRLVLQSFSVGSLRCSGAESCGGYIKGVLGLHTVP